VETQLFPAVPEDLAAVSDEELRDLLAEFRTVSGRCRDGQIDLAETFPGLSQTDASAALMEAWRAAAVTAQSLRAEQTRREEEVGAFAVEADEIHAVFGEDDEATPAASADDAAVEGESDESDTSEAAAEELAAEGDDTESADADDDESDDEDGDAETAAASVPAVRQVRYPAVPRSHSPRIDGEAVATLIAAAGNTGVRAGDPLDRNGYAEALIEIARRRGAVHKVSGGGEERILVASVDFPFPEERRLENGPRSAGLNRSRIAALGNPFLGNEGVQALLASGGLCAPLTPFYDLPQFSTTARPVRDGLPSFRADRGGVSVPSVSDLGDITTAITVIEEEDDAQGGTFATKSCQAMDCADWTDVAVGIIAHCREYGNLNARAWPEGVAHENDNTMAAHARTAEGRLLDRIDALSLAITRAAVYGASSTLLYALQVSRAGIISRLRMDPSTRFRVILPFWAAEMFSQDLVNSKLESRFDTPPEQVGALLSRFGFNVIWHLDEGLAGGAADEVWADEAGGGAQDDWPGTTVQARVFPEGEFLHLDGGTLELGLVRDSNLNSTNDYQLFGETFENLARIGPVQAAHTIAITICPTGAFPADATAINCS
jgi:hypothetical protein